MNYNIGLLLVLVAIYLLHQGQKKKTAASRQIVRSRLVNRINGNEENGMKDLAERFIGKDIYVRMLEGTADGVVKEVTDSGMVLENKEGIQIVNFNYVVKIREYPYKKGKRAVVFE